MRKVVLTGSLIASMFAGQLVFGQEAVKSSLKPGQLTISGQVRPRFEFRNGFKKPTQEGDEPSAFMEQRSRINMMYKAPMFNVKLSLQDVRIWGETGQINKTDGLTSFHEAYGEYTPNKNVALRIGRQELVYDDSRVLGNLGWAAQARSHDAVKFVYTDSTWQFHAIGTYNQDGLTPEPAKLQSPTGGVFNTPTPGAGSIDTDLNFALPNPLSSQILWFKKAFKGGNITLLAMNDLRQVSDSVGATTGVVAVGTFGTNVMYKAGDIKLNGTFYGQVGKTTGTQKTNGILGSLSATYTGGKKVIPTIGFDYVSGDDKETSDVTEGFDPLYGTHHKFYGFMDYFYVGNGHNGGGNQASGGLIDVYAKTVFKLGKPGKLLAHVHVFASPTDVTDDIAVARDATSEETLGSYLGTELDLVYVKPLAKNVTFKLGTSFMFQSDALDAAKNVSVDLGADDYNSIGLNNWSWAMIDFKF